MPDRPFPQADEPIARWMNIPIYYEDNHVLVALKPVNMLSQADRTGDGDILSALKEQHGAVIR